MKKILTLALTGLFFFSGCQSANSPRTSADTSGYASVFSVWNQKPVKVTPKVANYTVENDLGNLENTEDVYISEEVKTLLVKNSFAVESGYQSEFFSIYENNRYNYIPNFVTTDSMLHNYHLMFDHLLKTLEENKLGPALKKLNVKMLSASLKQYQSLKGTGWENAAKRNVGFFTVGSKLQTKNVQIPAIVKSEVNEELALIKDHQGITESPLMNLGADPDGDIELLKEDYSQYVPRGHYSKNEKLKSYFNSMMWYGRLTFRLKNEDEVKSAILITEALKGSEKLWDQIYEPVNFLVGKSDDITYYQFKKISEEIYGKKFDLKTLSSDNEKFATFIQESKKLKAPQINSIPIFNASIQPDREDEIKGFRFMGQRFTIDASIFQRLVDRETPNRMLPKGLDIPAAMGSAEALNILTDLGETKYQKYSENMDKMQKYLSGLPTSTWTQNLYWGWLYTLQPLLVENTEGYPSFMRNLAWTRKNLNTFLGSWTELKHDTILYAKQVYAEMGGGPGDPEKKDDRGYVEPNPELYSRLASLIKMTTKGLESRKILDKSMKTNLAKLEKLALSLKTISEKELNAEKLTEEEYELIRSYGGQLEHFWLEVNKKDMEAKGLSQGEYLQQNPATLVADVATDPNGQVLEEGIGNIANIYVAIPIEGKLKIAKGGVFSYYEFPWPLSDRLTDEKWRELLYDYENRPKLPSWTQEFMTE